MTKWRSVTEQLPAVDAYVEVLDSEGRGGCASLRIDNNDKDVLRWHGEFRPLGKIEWWRPMHKGWKREKKQCSNS